MSADEQDRYARQMGAGVLSAAGQARLKAATVLVTRVGGMGGPAAQMLAMAGVGHIILAHGGEMITADLNRQVLGQESGLGQLRAPAFAQTLRDRNRFIEVEAVAREPDDDEAVELARRCDLIVSCPPTFGERLRLNRAAAAANIPFIDAAQWGMSGTLMVMRSGETACLECVYPSEPVIEEFFPVVGAISSAIGSLAALEAIKVLSGDGRPLWGSMFTYDGFAGRTSIVKLQRRPDCACCGDAGGGEL
ncbi:MAG: HesA/MoeB/ThiF family protein [Pirellulaceae bacterium]|nr:HesA/MoeB/ThiF family protein [Pirellulaceae bacterium]